MANELVTVLFGLSLGAVYALVVLGIVLTYRMARFLNLAHGALGMFVTHVYWQMAVDWHWPALLSALASVVVVAPLLGVVVGRLLFRRLLDRDDSAKIAGSVVLIVALTHLVGRIWKGRPGNLPELLPRGSVRIGDAFFGANRAVIIALAIAIAVTLGLTLSRTVVGFSMRAIAEDRLMAGLFGVNVARTEAIGWAAATSLASLAGILISELGRIDPLQLTFLVIYGLAAAAFGRMVGVAGALAGAAVLGVVQGELTRVPGDVVARFGSLPAAAPFVLLVIALVVMVRLGLDIGGGDTDQTGNRHGALPLQTGTLRIARALRRSRAPRAVPTRVARVVGLVAFTISAAALIGSLLNATWLFLFTLTAVWTVVFASMALLNGLGGQVSLCQASFMGVGALVAVRLQQTCSTNEITGRPECRALSSDWRIWGGLIVAALVAGLVGVVVAAGTARVRGVMLAVVTLSFGFFLDQTILPSRDISGGELGYRMQRPTGFTSAAAYWVLCSLFAVGAVLLVRNLSRSGTGRVMRLVEQSPTAALAFGFAAPLYKVAVFGVSAAMAGVGGYLFAGLLQSYQGVNFNIFLSLLLFVVIYAVGTRRTMSPVAAGAAFVLVPKLLSYWPAVAGDANLVFALGALFTLGLPGGILGVLALHRQRADEAARPPGPRPAGPPATVGPQAAAVQAGAA